MAPVGVGGSEEQLKKYFGRLLEEPLMAVSEWRGWEGFKIWLDSLCLGLDTHLPVFMQSQSMSGEGGREGKRDWEQQLEWGLTTIVGKKI